MRGLTLKHLRYFDALARHKHFGRAAAACSISQPALSLQIKELEKISGGLLVERGARHIHMTALGKAFAERVGGILQAVDELDQLSRAAKDSLTGHLTLGVIPTIAPYLLPHVMKTLMQHFPALEVHPREAVTGALIEDLQTARIDLAIVALPISEPGLEEYKLFDEDFLLVRPQIDHAEPVPKPVQLRQLRLLLLEEGHCFRDQALSYCNMDGKLPKNLMEGSSLSTLVQMVGAGVGVTLIPEMALSIETRSAAVDVARFSGSPPKRTVGMIWRNTNPLSAKFAEIGGLVRKNHFLSD